MATHRLSKTAEYRAYQQAKYRCTNPNCKGYANYGGRGIEFRFTSFQQFLDAIGFRPSAKHSLERRDNSGHYEIGNVCWATKSEQLRNTRSNRCLHFQHIQRPIAEWAELVAIPDATIRRRLARGWSVEQTLTTPPRKYVKAIINKREQINTYTTA